MKRKQHAINVALPLVLASLFLWGCKPTTEGEIGDPFDKVQGMMGTWELSSFTQQDLNSPVKETRDLSAFFIDGVSTPIQLTFHEDRTYAMSRLKPERITSEKAELGVLTMTSTPLFWNFIPQRTPCPTTSVEWSVNLIKACALNTDANVAALRPTFTLLNSIESTDDEDKNKHTLCLGVRASDRDLNLGSKSICAPFSDGREF